MIWAGVAAACFAVMVFWELVEWVGVVRDLASIPALALAIATSSATPTWQSHVWQGVSCASSGGMYDTSSTHCMSCVCAHSHKVLIGFVVRSKQRRKETSCGHVPHHDGASPPPRASSRHARYRLHEGATAGYTMCALSSDHGGQARVSGKFATGRRARSIMAAATPRVRRREAHSCR